MLLYLVITTISTFAHVHLLPRWTFDCSDRFNLLFLCLLELWYEVKENVEEFQFASKDRQVHVSFYQPQPEMSPCLRKKSIISVILTSLCVCLKSETHCSVSRKLTCYLQVNVWQVIFKLLYVSSYTIHSLCFPDWCWHQNIILATSMRGLVS